MENGAKGILDVASYIEKANHIYRSVYGKDLSYTFRGPALSGLVAYLAGITKCNPLEHGFYSWAFFMNKRNVYFNINVSYNACKLLSYYDMYLPKNLTLYIDDELSAMEDIYQGSDRTFCLPEYDLNIYDETIAKYFANTKTDSEVVAFLGEQDKLPKSLSEFIKLNGFLHCKLNQKSHFDVIKEVVNSGADVYTELISCPEDVYERLYFNGCDENEAKRIARIVQKEGGKLNLRDKMILTEYGGEEFCNQSEKIQHLYYRSHLFEKSCLSVAVWRQGA